MLDVDAALKSTEYKSYILAACELEKVQLDSMSPSAAVAFFMNVYQCMYIHNFLKIISTQEASANGVLKNIKNYMFNQ